MLIKAKRLCFSLRDRIVGSSPTLPLNNFNNMITAILLPIILVIIAGVFYAYSITKMDEEHPDYKGDDFLN